MPNQNSNLRFLSLLPTPILVFISNALPLYIINQSELNYQWTVLAPFIIAAFVTLLFGLFLLSLQSSLVSRTFIWLYYLSGPGLLIYSLLRGIESLGMETGPSLFTYTLFLFFFVAGLASRVEPSKFVSLFAVFGTLLVLQTVISVGNNVELKEGSHQSLPRLPQFKSSEERLPNIYHLVLDEYQSDFFDTQISDTLKSKLSGFKYYSNASALYDMTNWSIPSMFLGEEYRSQETDLSYQNRAFNSESSFLHQLKDTGYSTSAYTRKLYPFDLGLFDETYVHSKNSMAITFDNRDAFIALWVYRVLPNLLSKKLAENRVLIDPTTYASLNNNTFLADSAPQESMLSYLNYLANEHKLTGHSRYTYIHLLLPHSPYIYSSDCEEINNSSMAVQSECATKLILDLVTELRKLGRYDRSLIIVNGDHGSNYRKSGSLWKNTNDGRSHRSLLLIKPSLADSEKPLSRIQASVSILDISKGIEQFLEMQTGLHKTMPWWKYDQLTSMPQPERFFFRVNQSNQTMQKFKIDDGQKLLPLGEFNYSTSNSTENFRGVATVFPVNKVIEAENGFLSPATEVGNTIPGVHGSYVSLGTKTYQFSLAEKAEVRIRIRVLAPNGNSDSTFLRINDGAPLRWDIAVREKWHWSSYKSSWVLDKGLHTVSFLYREPIYIDQIELVSTASSD